MTIYDLITVQELATYWSIVVENEPPFIGEELFPDDKQLGLKLSWLKGANRTSVVLRPSAFDVKAIPRKRIGFERLETEMPYFKESMYIDEEMRQQLLMVMQSTNQAYIDVIINRIFDDEMQLLRAARIQRERMRMMLLTTGTIVLQGNGQIYDYDYSMPQSHKVETKKSWSDPTASIIQDINDGIQKIRQDTGVELARAITTSKVIGYMRKNNEIRASLTNTTNKERFLSDSEILTFISDATGIRIAVNDKIYKDEDEETQRFVDEELFVMFPSGMLGKTWFGTTPEEADLMASGIASVAIVDTGVAITTIKHADPVQVETKVSMICMPDLPTADQIYILDTKVGE